MNSLVHWFCNPVFLFGLQILATVLSRLLNRNRIAKILLVTSISWIILAGSTPLPQWLVFSLESRYKPFELSGLTKPYPQNILILGGGHIISPDLPPGIQLSGSATLRLAEAMRIRRLLESGKLVCSGSSASHRTTQAEMLALAAVEMGVAAEDTLQLRSPKRTSEEISAYRARFGPGPVIVVSSACHMARVLAISSREGLAVLPAPTDYLLKRDPAVSQFEFYPSVQKLAMMESALHEYLGLLEMWVRG